MTLYIDTTNFDSVTYVVVGKKLLKETFKIDPRKSYETLGKLEQFLKAVKIKMPDIKKIVANKGPGSYTGVRVGAAHALAISLALGVPLKFLDKTKFNNVIKNPL